MCQILKDLIGPLGRKEDFCFFKCSLHWKKVCLLRVKLSLFGKCFSVLGSFTSINIHIYRAKLAKLVDSASSKNILLVLSGTFDIANTDKVFPEKKENRLMCCPTDIFPIKTKYKKL